MVFLPKLLELISREAPAVNIHTVQVPAQRMRAVALNPATWISPWDIRRVEGSIHQQVLFEEHYVGIVRANHPTIRDSITFEQFLRTPHLVYQPSGGGHGSQENVVDKAFWAAGVERRVAVRVAHTMGITSMVSNTGLAGSGPAPPRAGLRHARGCHGARTADRHSQFNIAQYWHDRFHTDPGNRWLRSVFARLYGRPRRTGARQRLGSRIGRRPERGHPPRSHPSFPEDIPRISTGDLTVAVREPYRPERRVNRPRRAASLEWTRRRK